MARVAISSMVIICMIIVAVLTILEMIGDIFISWFPMYGWLKLALFISTTQASSYVYGIALRPLLAEYEADIDQELQRWRAKCSQLVQSAFLSVL
jgi:receptor expression-enhancing protein 1/2/3/4